MLALADATTNTSHLPWYIAGGIIAAWAVVLAAVGLTRPGFPYGRRGQGLVILISLVLAVGAMAMAVLSA